MDENSKKINIGVIGSGFGAQVHIPAFLSHPDCRVTALFSRSFDKAKTLSEKFHIEKAYTDWELMIRSANVDAVSIAMPPNMQKDIALAALSAKKAVFCEKPLAADLYSAETMASAAKKSGLANMVDFEFPELALWEKAKEMLDGGDIGALNRVAVSWNVTSYANKMGLDIWKTREADSGGALNLLTSHVFHYLEWFAGDITNVSASMQRSPGNKRTADTSNEISVIFASGASGKVSVNNDAASPSIGHRVEFFGDQAKLILDNNTPDHANGFRLFASKHDSKKLELVADDEELKKNTGDSRTAPVSRVVGRFLNWIKTGARQKPDFNDGLRVQYLLDAARRSNSTGQAVKIDQREK